MEIFHFEVEVTVMFFINKMADLPCLSLVTIYLRLYGKVDLEGVGYSCQVCTDRCPTYLM